MVGGLGAAGEVLPYIRIGTELKQRGHCVDFIGSPHYAATAVKAGLSAVSVGTMADHQKLVTDHGCFGTDRKSGRQIIEEHYFPHVRAFYRATVERIQGGPVIVVGTEAGAATAAEQYGVPRARLVLSPGRLASRYDPPHPERVLPPWAAWFARDGRRLAVLNRLDSLRRGVLRPTPAIRPIPTDHPIARLRSELGLAAAHQSTHRPRLTVCLWPGWFSAPQPDWPAGTRLAGFPLPLAGRGPLDADSARVRMPLVVATTGSVARGQTAFFATLVQACRILGWRASLVTPHRDHLPQPLPPGVTYLAYASFGEIFGRASLVVHHGGIGTTAFALAAGVPQIVMPLRGEQFDIGNRVSRLGTARMLSVDRTSPERLSGLMRSMVASPRVADRCRHWQARLGTDHGITAAADLLEGMGGTADV